MANILTTILAQKSKEVSALKTASSLQSIRSLAEQTRSPRDFVGAIQTQLTNHKPAVIAEIKKASPSKGVIRENFSPSEIAQSYEQYGATCLSVLTDAPFFQGSLDHLQQARAHCNLPLLRKDFIIDPYQIYEARAAGADCILLIVAALDLPTLKQLESIAHSLNMAVLVEVHNFDELQSALELNTPLIGINNRNLQTFVTNLHTTLALTEYIPSDRIIITESGIHTLSDVQLMQHHHVNAFLIGEAFMRQPNPGIALSQLFSTQVTQAESKK